MCVIKLSTSETKDKRNISEKSINQRNKEACSHNPKIFKIEKETKKKRNKGGGRNS